MRHVHASTGKPPNKFGGVWLPVSVLIGMLVLFYGLPLFGVDPVGDGIDAALGAAPIATAVGFAVLATLYLVNRIRRYTRNGRLADLLWGTFIAAALLTAAALSVTAAWAARRLG
jgi:uncharacterized membrane protein